MLIAPRYPDTPPADVPGFVLEMALSSGTCHPANAWVAVALPHARAAMASLSLDDQEVLLLRVLEGPHPH